MEKINAASIQKHIEIKEIRDDVIFLKNGGMRAVLMTTSLNFALRSVDEQDAIIFQYQNFLNSLDFSIQIVAASRRFNIKPYLESLEQKQIKQENQLLKMQSYEYIDFVKGLTELTNIMTESFYVVVPYSPSIVKKSSFFDVFSSKQNHSAKEQKFQEIKNDLWQRVEFVVSGLRGAGVKAIPLKTDELIELFYKLYNPSAKEDAEIKKSKDMRNQ
ncbi:hypothetical protein KKG85_00775 [Patescibacteria group bacterium]|nr:hypothetical protein [Patescibacteria group bacterium]MBU2579671.1 hypothetical protein [Patescibacteria group bacterium]